MTGLRSVTIVSGGQTGADRAALDFAIERGLQYDGWCPRGRMAEDGPLAERYQLRQTPSRRYAERTEWNVRDSDATVIFTIAMKVTGGTALTQAIARRLGRPCLHLARDERTVDEAASLLRDLLSEHQIGRLNVAGPPESQEPSVGPFVEAVLKAALAGDR